MDLHLAAKNRQMKIYELEEWREKAYHSSKIYKENQKLAWQENQAQGVQAWR